MDMKKKLIIVTGSMEIGGAERHLATILPLLADKGWTIQVFILAKKGALASVLEEKNIPVNCLLTSLQLNIIQKLPFGLHRFARVLFPVLTLAKKLRSENDAILHFFLPEAYVIGMLGAILAKFKGPKLMSRRSMNNYQKRRPEVGWFEKRLHPKVNAIVANSTAVLSQLQKEEGIPASQLKLIYNGIDLKAFNFTQLRHESRKRLGIPNDVLVMVMVANLIPYKGHKDLLHALHQIKNKLPQGWYLICIGRDDGIGDSLREIAEDLKLSQHLLWLESRNDVPDLLALSDIGILCSHEEGFSNAVLEGMAASLPMVVTDVGGNKEAVLDDKTGYVVAAHDHKALAAAILRLIEDPKKAKQFGEAGYLRVKECFSVETCVNAYIKLYEAYLLPPSKIQQIREN